MQALHLGVSNVPAAMSEVERRDFVPIPLPELTPAHHQVKMGR